MSRILFLDDRESRWLEFREKVLDHDALWVHDAGDCIAALCRHKGPWDLLFLDYDLNDNPSVEPQHRLSNNGLTVTHLLCCGRFNVRKIVVHSNNEHPAKLMRDMLVTAGYDAVRSPFERYEWVDLLKTRGT